MNDRPKIEIVDREMAEVLRGKTERARGWRFPGACGAARGGC